MVMIGYFTLMRDLTNLFNDVCLAVEKNPIISEAEFWFLLENPEKFGRSNDSDVFLIYEFEGEVCFSLLGKNASLHWDNLVAFGVSQNLKFRNLKDEGFRWQCSQQ